MTDDYAVLARRGPGAIPASIDPVLQQYLSIEMTRIWAALSQLAAGHLPKTHVVPDRPRDGDIRYADGTDWNPGTGEGAYFYYNSTWNKLG